MFLKKVVILIKPCSKGIVYNCRDEPHSFDFTFCMTWCSVFPIFMVIYETGITWSKNHCHLALKMPPHNILSLIPKSLLGPMPWCLKRNLGPAELGYETSFLTTSLAYHSVALHNLSPLCPYPFPNVSVIYITFIIPVRAFLSKTWIHLFLDPYLILTILLDNVQITWTPLAPYHPSSLLLIVVAPALKAAGLQGVPGFCMGSIANKTLLPVSSARYTKAHHLASTTGCWK